jgi:hypothetical protein
MILCRNSKIVSPVVPTATISRNHLFTDERYRYDAAAAEFKYWFSC